MKIRIRQLKNDQWIVEMKRWYEFGWSAVRIDRTQTTRGAAALGIFEIPRIVNEKPGNNNYPLTWHSSQESAVATYKEASALLGI